MDSVAALTPQAEIAGEMGDSHMGLQARLMSQALRKLTAIIGSIFLVFSAILLYVFSAELVKTMTSDIEVISISVWILRMQCITMPFVGFFAVSSMLLQNIGKYLMASILSVSRQGIFFIPLLYILSCLFSQYGIYLLQPFSDILSFALAVFMVRSVWKSFIKII